ncbi:MAG: hypothetical protein GX198_01485 [Epulopiscium sp.]|nr:hypothetical protein [Candidatus Epulonipiscium sp.]
MLIIFYYVQTATNCFSNKQTVVNGKVEKGKLQAELANKFKNASEAIMFKIIEDREE